MQRNGRPAAAAVRSFPTAGSIRRSVEGRCSAGSVEAACARLLVQ